MCNLKIANKAEEYVSLELITDIYAVNKRVHNLSNSGLLMEDKYVELKEKKSKKLTLQNLKI